MSEENTQSDAQSTDAAGAGTEESQGTGAQENLDTGTADGAAANAAADAVKAADAPWFKDMPETSHEALKGFDDLDSLVEAAARGKDYSPASDVSEYSVSYDGVDASADENMAAYQQFCFENGITPGQAQALVDWQEDISGKLSEARLEAGVDALKAEWGNKYEQNKEQSLVALQMLDRRLGMGLSKMMNETGLSKDPMMIKTLHLISTAISEDSLGGSSPGAVDNDTEEDPREGFKKMGFK